MHNHRSFYWMLIVVSLYAVQSFAETYTTRIKKGDDTFLQSAKPSATPGKFTQLMVGKSSFATRGTTKSLIRFDLTSTTGNFTTVSAARLKVYLLSTDGITFTNDTVKVYRISATNRNWGEGTGTTIGDSVTGGACWKWKQYDNTSYAFDDPVGQGRLRRHPWRGDSLDWNDGRGSLASVEGGLWTAGVDYFATPVARGIVSSTDKNSTITITFSDVSFFKSWSDNAADNAGFILDLGRVDTTKFDCLTLGSFDHTDLTYLPILELDFSDWTGQIIQNIEYPLPVASKVSMLIRNSKQVVKEILWSSPQSAGAQSIPWDAKDLLGNTVPDGTYDVRILAHQGLMAEYMGTLGISRPYWEGWMGNHFAALSLAVDSTGVYIAGGGEWTPSIIKIREDGTRIWSPIMPDPIPDWEGWGAIASDNGKLYALTTDRLIRSFPSNGAPVTWTSRDPALTITTSFRSGLINPVDMDVRSGKMVLATAYTNQLEWRSAATCSLLSTVAVATIAGVALDNTGRALCISGNQIIAFTEGNATPTTVIGTGLTFPYRLSINRTNGDIYVSELAPNHQIKRFNSSGVLQATYGKQGGRPINGIYNPDTGFLNVFDIAAATDGSFWICEGVWGNGVRRQSHFGLNGKVIKEFYGGTLYAGASYPDPDDPSIVWQDIDAQSLARTKVDWVNKTWTILETYQFSPADNDSNIIERSPGTGCRWLVRKHNGNTYLTRTMPMTVLYYDPVGHRLLPVSKAGTPWFVKEVAAIRNAAGGPSDWGGCASYFSWYDKNLNSTPEVGEWTWSDNQPVFGTWFNLDNQKVLGPDENLNYYIYFPKGPDNESFGKHWGVGIMSPQWTTVSGIEIPVYNWDTGLRFLNPTVETLARTGTAAQYTAFNDSIIIPGRANDYISPNNSNYAHPRAGCLADDSGNVYGAFKSTINHFVTKWDKNGVNQWSVGRSSVTAGAPPSGALNSPDHIMGVVKNCLVLADFIGPVNHVWNEDGLYIGNMLEGTHPNSIGNPRSIYGNQSGEQFTGSVVEIKTNNTPGLAKGDILFFGAGFNNIPVHRIHGFNELKRMSTTITVTGGKVVSQGVVGIGSGHSNPATTVGRLSTVTMRINAGSTIDYSTTTMAPVTLELFTVLGQKAVVLVNNKLTAPGAHHVSLSGLRIPAGHYFVRLKTGSSVLIRQATILP